MRHELPLVDDALVVLFVVLLLHQQLQVVGDLLVSLVPLHLDVVLLRLIAIDSVIGILLYIPVTRAGRVAVFDVLKESRQTHVLLSEFIHEGLRNLGLTHTHAAC